MADYWRPSYGGRYKEKIEQFLRDHPEIPFEEDEAKEFAKFCVDRFIVDVETSEREVEKAKEQLKDIQEKLG